MPDTQAPAAVIAAPLANSSVSGLVAVNVNTNDNVGVASVELKIKAMSPLSVEFRRSAEV